MFTMEYYSVISSNNVGSRVEAWMDLEPVTQSEVSQQEKNRYCMLTHTHIYRGSRKMVLMNLIAGWE